MISLSTVLLRLLPVGNGEVLCAHVQDVFHTHPMTAGLPSFQPISCPPSDGVGCGDILVSFQYHFLEDDEPLLGPLSVLHPAQLSPQRLNNLSPDFPDRRIIAP